MVPSDASEAMSERDLDGRCGTCGFFVSLRRDDTGAALGDCRLGCWPSPLKDTGTCSSYKRVGESFAGSLKRKRAAGSPRPRRDASETVEVRPTIPSEIGIDMNQDEFRQVLREVLLDELGVRDTKISERFAGGELTIKPGREGTAPKTIPVDIFFRKIVQVRDKLRVLESKINGNKGLSADEKVQLQQYVTGCYGSLTTFNVLFKDKADHFVGQKS